MDMIRANRETVFICMQREWDWTNLFRGRAADEIVLEFDVLSLSTFFPDYYTYINKNDDNPFASLKMEDIRAIKTLCIKTPQSESHVRTDIYDVVSCNLNENIERINTFGFENIRGYVTFKVTPNHPLVNKGGMLTEPSGERLKELVNSICDHQEKMVRTLGMTSEQNRSIAAKLEPLKTPIYFLWEFLGYGDFPNNKTQRRWLSSFNSSPSDYLSECIMQIKNGEIPLDDCDLSRTLIDFYLEIKEKLES